MGKGMDGTIAQGAYLLTEHQVGFSGHEGTWHKRLKDSNWMEPRLWGERSYSRVRNHNEGWTMGWMHG